MLSNLSPISESPVNSGTPDSTSPTLPISKQAAQRNRRKQRINSLPIQQSTMLESCTALSNHDSTTPLSFSETLLLALVKQIGQPDETLKDLIYTNNGQLSMLEKMFEDREFAGIENAGLIDRCKELSTRCEEIKINVDVLTSEKLELIQRMTAFEASNKQFIEENRIKEEECYESKKDVAVRIEYEQELIRKSVLSKAEARNKSTRSSLLFSKLVVGDPFKIVKERWRADEGVVACHGSGCSVSFGVVERKHHCRRCGEIFCGKHTSKKVFVSLVDYSLDAENGFNVRYGNLL